MAEDDIGARSFKNYDSTIAYLERMCGWDTRAAHAEFCDAVADGRLRRESNPAPTRFDPGAYKPWLRPPPIVAPVWIRKDGSVSGEPVGKGYLEFWEDRYSVSDLEQLVERCTGSRQPHTPEDDIAAQPELDWSKLGAFPGDMQLVERIDQMVTAGKARTIREAAVKLAADAAGPATEDSKARRLARLHKTWKVMNS